MSDSELQVFNGGNDDIAGKIVQANMLEGKGEIDQAIALYQEILEFDQDSNYGAVAQQALANLQKSPTSRVQRATEAQSDVAWWQKLSLRWKVTGIAIAMSTIPVIGIGAIAYSVANQSLTEKIAQTEKSRTEELADKVNRFMFERYGDIQIISQLEMLNNPKIASTVPLAQKEQILDNFVKTYGVYDSVAAFDLNGNVIAQSKGEKLGNQLNQEYIQAALKTGKPYIARPEISKSSGTYLVSIAAPITEVGSKKIIGAVRSQMPVSKLENLVASYTLNGEEYHLIDASGSIFLAMEPEAIGKNIKEYLPGIAKYRSNRQSDTFLNTEDFVAYSPFGSLEGMFPLNWEAVIDIEKNIAFALQRKLLLTLALGTGITALAVSALAAYLGYQGTLPLLRTSEAVKKLGEGELDVRIDVRGKDELADLGSNINLMAGQMQNLLHIQEAEAKSQQRQKETLQQGVMGLLLDVEGAQKGDLTVRAAMSDGAVGSIADAFNSTLKKIQELLQTVQTVSSDVGQLSLAGEGSVRQLSDSALAQAVEIDQALTSIDEIDHSVKTIADFAQEAAKIARNGSIQAREGDLAMDATVSSIEKIRGTVANTSKKVKQLAESSQEIAQIVEIISGISEKTNLLAFNASVEAARAGEHGEGFRIVAEEVRRLADRITGATKDIQQLVTAIQQDTTSVLQGMETSTSEVVNGSELVKMTKLNLQSLAKTTQQIDSYLESISTNTTIQTDNSRQVNEKINGIALVAKTNSSETQNVLKSLQTLVREAEALQLSVSQFKL